MTMIKILYRRYILNPKYPHVAVANDVQDVKYAEAHPGFVRWIDTYWKEVTV